MVRLLSVTVYDCRVLCHLRWQEACSNFVGFPQNPTTMVCSWENIRQTEIVRHSTGYLVSPDQDCHKVRIKRYLWVRHRLQKIGRYHDKYNLTQEDTNGEIWQIYIYITCTWVDSNIPTLISLHYTLVIQDVGTGGPDIQQLPALSL